MTDFTVADVLAWARTKPADEAYAYDSPFNCALCHFLRDTDRAARPIVGPYGERPEEDYRFSGWRENHGGAVNPYPREMEPALKNGGTFGGLADMLEKICPETPVTSADWGAIDAYLTDIDAIAIETRQSGDRETGLRPKDESADPKGIAQEPRAIAGKWEMGK